MERIAFDFGIIQVYWYSIFIFLGMLAAVIVIYKESQKHEMDKEFMINLAFTTIISGIIGARLYYVAFNWGYYSQNLYEILEIWNGGLAIHGGIIFGLGSVIYNCRKYRINTLKMLDIIVVGVILGQAIGRWGNFFNSEAYGAVTTLKHLQALHLPNFIINGMYILGDYREPAFLYESLLNLVGFVILILFRKRKNLRIGQLTGIYFMWYSLGRFLIEAGRADSLMIGSLKVAQLVSIMLFLVGILIFIYYPLIKKDKSDNSLYHLIKQPEAPKQLFTKVEAIHVDETPVE